MNFLAVQLVQCGQLPQEYFGDVQVQICQLSVRPPVSSAHTHAFTPTHTCTHTQTHTDTHKHTHTLVLVLAPLPDAGHLVSFYKDLKSDRTAQLHITLELS